MTIDPATGTTDSPATRSPIAIARGADSVLARLAFYGGKNQAGGAGIRDLGWQLHACQRAADSHVFTRYFYDLPVVVDEPLELAVHDAGGPPRRDGGWTELVAVLPATDRAFDAIVCSDFDRLSCNSAVTFEPEELAAAHGVAVLYADMHWPRSLADTATVVRHGRWLFDHIGSPVSHGLERADDR